MTIKINAAARLQSAAGIKPITKARIESAEKKLKARAFARVQVHAIELPKFRYIDDVTRFLDTMKDEIDETDKLIKVYQTQLAYLKRPNEKFLAMITKASMEFTITQDDTKRITKRKIDPELTKVVLPTGGVKKLEEQYALSEDLYEKHRTLEAVETQLSMQFPDRRGEAYENTIAALNVLKGKVAKQLKTVLAYLNDVAAKHLPKTFEKYIDAVRQEVQEHVLFEDSNMFLYVSTTPEKELVFTAYIMLVNATNDEGEVTPQLYISIQWIVGGTVSIQINPEYELPGQLLKEGGTEVGSTPEAAKAIGDLLAMEEFATSLGTAPLSTLLRKPADQIDPKIFSYRDFIAKLDVDSDKLIFKLRPGVSEEEATEISRVLFVEVKALFKNSRSAKIKQKVSTKQIEFTVHNVAEGGEVSMQDAEFLRDRFELKDAVLRKVVNILNTGKGKGKKTTP